jgi:hypothetical protein
MNKTPSLPAKEKRHNQPDSYFSVDVFVIGVSAIFGRDREIDTYFW